LRTLALPLLLLTACGTDVPDSDTSDPDVTADVTYYPDVQPIVDAQCVRCHNPDGVGPFDFSDAQTFASFAERALARVEAGTMPPAVSDPECHPYVGQEHMNVPEGTAELLADWIEQGKVMGDPADAVPIEPIPVDLPEVDLQVMMEAPYTPVYTDERNPGNEYRCFYLDPSDEDIYIGGLHPVVDNAAMVHHMVLFTVPDAEVPAQAGPEGVDCIDMSAGGDGMIAAWAPGMLPIELPEGAAIKVDRNRTLVLQMHYYDAAPPGSSDQSGYAFDLVPSATVTDEVFMLPLGAFDFEIPAGDPAYTHHTSLTLPDWFGGAKIYATFPHMHVLGTGYRLWYTREGRENCLAESDRYDFENQLTYVFPEPIQVTGGDTLHLECTWNNSTSNPELIHDPPIPIGYGERTDEEMCYAFTLVSL